MEKEKDNDQIQMNKDQCKCIHMANKQATV